MKLAPVWEGLAVFSACWAIFDAVRCDWPSVIATCAGGLTLYYLAALEKSG